VLQDKYLEPERLEGPPLSVTGVNTGRDSPVSGSIGQSSTSGGPNRLSYSASANSTAWIASNWSAVGEMCHDGSNLLT